MAKVSLHGESRDHVIHLSGWWLSWGLLLDLPNFLRQVYVYLWEVTDSELLAHLTYLFAFPG